MPNEKFVPTRLETFVTPSQFAAVTEAADSSDQPTALVVHDNVACYASVRAMLI